MLLPLQVPVQRFFYLFCKLFSVAQRNVVHSRFSRCEDDAVTAPTPASEQKPNHTVTVEAT